MIKNAKLPGKAAPDEFARGLVGIENIAQLGIFHRRQLHRAGDQLGNVVKADGILQIERDRLFVCRVHGCADRAAASGRLFGKAEAVEVPFVNFRERQGRAGQKVERGRGRLLPLGIRHGE